MSTPVIEGYKNDRLVFGFFIIFRIMLGAAIYHALQSLALIGVKNNKDRRSIVQNGLWPIKVFTLIGCCTVCFYIPPEYFRSLFYVALVGASLSILIQSFLLIDVAYEYAEFLVSRYEETSSDGYKYLLIGSTVVFNLVILVGSIFLFIRFEDTTDRTFVILNACSSFLMSILSALESVQEFNPRAGIFQSSLLGCYNFYLICSALLSKPENKSPYSLPWINTLATMGYFIAMFFVAFSAFRAGQASHKLLITKPQEGDDDDIEEEEFSRSFFHLMFLLAALQLAIIMNRWRIPFLNEADKLLEIRESSIAYIVKIGTGWLITLLYIWSLFAPYFFPNRDFS